MLDHVPRSETTICSYDLCAGEADELHHGRRSQPSEGLGPVMTLIAGYDMVQFHDLYVVFMLNVAKKKVMILLSLLIFFIDKCKFPRPLQFPIVTAKSIL